MNEAATKRALAGQLHVAIHSASSTGRGKLSRLVAEAGHIPVNWDDEADVALCDGDGPPPDSLPSVILGATNDASQGALPYNAGPQQIDAALRAVVAGLVVHSPEVTDTGFGAMNETGPRTLLTPRELEVLTAMADGMTNKSIARHLDISLHTVKFHIESVFRKLGAHTRTEAVAKALERRRRETITL